MLVILSFECIFNFFNWSRLVELPSSDEMKMFYTEHDFQVDLENFEFKLKFHADRIQHISYKKFGIIIHSNCRLIIIGAETMNYCHEYNILNLK